MPAGARLFPASPKPNNKVVRPAPRSVKVSFSKAARDPKFMKVVDRLQGTTARALAHPHPQSKSAQAQAAAKAPANEKQAGAQSNKVDEIQETKGEKPKEATFLEVLRAEIEKVMPKTLDDADKFMKGGEKEQIKGAVGGNVKDQKEKAAGPTEKASAAAPDTGKVEGKDQTNMPADPAVALAQPNAGQGMPDPVAKTAVEDPAKKANQTPDEKMKEAEVTPIQLQKANDPRFSAVLDAKTSVQTTAEKGKQNYRNKEKQTLTQATAKAQAEGGAGIAAFGSIRGKSAGKVKSKQELAKEKDEQERKTVTDTIQGIFEKTKTKVDDKLAALETEVMGVFDAGSEAALSNMKSWANQEIDRYKDDRYSGILGKGRWIADLFRDCPEGIKAILRQARQRFVEEMDALVVKVSGLVDQRLQEAKDLVTAGQAEIKTYVSGLPKKLQSVGKEAESNVASSFDELRSAIEDKKNDLANKLAQKYKDATDKADAELKKMEEENAGALKKFADKLVAVIKALLEFKSKLMAILKKGWETIKLILADPIGFLGNLIAAVKLGFSNFVSNIWTHLKAGFMKWLFGSLAGSGVEIPSDLSLPSILKLVLGVLGITYDRMRAKAVKLIGERNVALIEKLVDYIKTLITGGPAALWEKIKEDLSNLKEMVIDAIQTWLIETVVKNAVVKILSMFNPAGAIVQAVIMIYNVVVFIVERISQIMELIEAIINSVHAIATGAIAGAAAWIEKALANAVPVLIGLLAAITGLGKISGKVVEFIKKVQSRVDKAIDKFIAKAVAYVKKLFGAAKAKVAELILRFTKKKPAGAGHQMWVDESGEPQVASSAMTLSQRIANWKKRKVDPKDQNAATTDLNTLTGMNTELKDAAKKALAARQAKDATKLEAEQKRIDAVQANLPAILTRLFKLFGDTSEGRAEEEGEIFATVELYDQTVVPLGAKKLIKGSPKMISSQFKAAWNNDKNPSAQGWARGFVTQMRRVVDAAKNVGTGKPPYLTAVEIFAAGKKSRIDYTIIAQDKESKHLIDAAVEVKRYGEMRKRKKKDGTVESVAQQITKRVNTVRKQVETSLRDPQYTLVILEIQGFDKIPAEMRSILVNEFINFRGLADSMTPKKKFIWRKI